MDIGLIVTFAGIVVAALAGVLGVWMERDPVAPPRWAYVFSAFIVVAMLIEMGHSIAQAAEDGETEEAMARVLEQLSDLAANSDNPALTQFVGSELAAQARNNPRVMKKLERKVAAKGGDPTALRKKAAEGRRSAAGLPARAPAKAGKSGAARPEGAGAREGKAGGTKTPGAVPEGGAKAKAAVPGDPAVPGTKAKAGGAAVPAPVPGAPAVPGVTAPAPAKAKGGKSQ